MNRLLLCREWLASEGLVKSLTEALVKGLTEAY